MNTRTKLIGTVALGAALLVPVAQAQSPDDRDGLRGPGGIAALQTDAASTHPDNRAVRGTGSITSAASKNAALAGPPLGWGMSSTSNPAAAHPDNRAEARGPGLAGTVVVQPASSRFDWSDAMIGGLGGVGFVLLLVGCVFLLTSQRNKTRLA